MVPSGSDIIPVNWDTEPGTEPLLVIHLNIICNLSSKVFMVTGIRIIMYVLSANENVSDTISSGLEPCFQAVSCLC